MNSSKSAQQYLFYVLGIFLFLASSIVSAGTLQFSYTSDTDGYLGFFSVDESIFKANIGTTAEGWLNNQYIEDLNFSFRGDVWTKEDIYKNDYTIFEGVGGVGLPTVQGGSGFLAWFSPVGNIALYGDGLMNIGNVALIQGTWSTTYVNSVPEPSTYASLILGLLLIGFYFRNNKRT